MARSKLNFVDTATVVWTVTDNASADEVDVSAAAGSGATFGTPAIVLGTAGGGGSATTAVRSDATIAAFDATAPTTSAVGDAAAVGSVALAARRDHKHAREGFGTAGASAPGDTVAAGSNTTLSHSDHRHSREAFGASGDIAAVAGSVAAGASGKVADASHAHVGVHTVVAGTGIAVSSASGDVTVSTSGDGSRAYNSGAVSIGASAETVVTLDSERSDSAGFHSVSSNTGRMTVPTGKAGRYTIAATVEWAASALGTLRRLSIRLNGTTFLAKNEITSIINAALPQEVSTIYDLADGDYVEMVAFQDTIGAVNINAAGNYSPEFAIVRNG